MVGMLGKCLGIVIMDLDGKKIMIKEIICIKLTDYKITKSEATLKLSSEANTKQLVE